MQGAVQKYPTVEQFDTPSPDLNLEVKTDGRTYVKPPPPPEKTTEEKSDEEKKKEPGQEDDAAKPEEKRTPGVRQTPPGARPDRQPARQTPARPSPSPASSASPAADGG
jgi:hypothetical protein